MLYYLSLFSYTYRQEIYCQIYLADSALLFDAPIVTMRVPNILEEHKYSPQKAVRYRFNLYSIAINTAIDIILLRKNESYFKQQYCHTKSSHIITTDYFVTEDYIHLYSYTIPYSPDNCLDLTIMCIFSHFFYRSKTLKKSRHSKEFKEELEKEIKEFKVYLQGSFTPKVLQDLNSLNNKKYILD